MKYLIILILSVFFVISCGKKEDNRQNQTQQNIPDTSAMTPEQKKIAENRKKMTELLTPEKTITSAEAKDYVGKVVCVRGYVADIYKSDSVEFLNFEEKYPKNPFTGVIFKEKFGEFGDANVFLHKVCELTGRVSLYKNKPEIVMISKLQIIIDSRVPEGNKK